MKSIAKLIISFFFLLFKHQSSPFVLEVTLIQWNKLLRTNFCGLKKSQIMSVFIFANRLIYKLSQVLISANITKMANIFANFTWSGIKRTIRLSTFYFK